MLEKQSSEFWVHFRLSISRNTLDLQGARRDGVRERDGTGSGSETGRGQGGEAQASLLEERNGKCVRQHDVCVCVCVCVCVRARHVEGNG